MIKASEISSRQIRVFLAVMEEGGLGKAARRLYLTQPAISQALASLENSLDIKLFKRTRRGVIPTKAADILLEGILKSEEHINHALIKIAEMSELKTGYIAVAASDTLSLYLLADSLANFRKKYPNIELNVRNRSSDEIVELVRRRSVDLGLISLRGDEKGLNIKCIDESPLMLIIPYSIETTLKRRPKLDFLENLNLILLEKSSRIRKNIEEALIAYGKDLKIIMEVSSFEVAKRFVMKGLGSSLVPEMALEKSDRNKFRILPSPVEIPPVRYGVVTLPGSIDPATSKLIESFHK
jgi:DNA-binding transcriptional LysR family regulator